MKILGEPDIIAAITIIRIHTRSLLHKIRYCMERNLQSDLKNIDKFLVQKLPLKIKIYVRTSAAKMGNILHSDFIREQKPQKSSLVLIRLNDLTT